MIKVSKLTILSFFLNLLFYNSFSQKKPNIIWIYAEDTSPWMGCYGDEINKGYTPNIDSIANSGVRFNRAYVTAPVCSASRSAIIVGQSAIRYMSKTIFPYSNNFVTCFIFKIFKHSW